MHKMRKAVAGCRTRVMTTCLTDGRADGPTEFRKLHQAEGKLQQQVGASRFAQRAACGLDTLDGHGWAQRSF